MLWVNRLEPHQNNKHNLSSVLSTFYSSLLFMHKDNLLAEKEGQQKAFGFTVGLDWCVNLQIQSTYDISLQLKSVSASQCSQLPIQ